MPVTGGSDRWDSAEGPPFHCEAELLPTGPCKRSVGLKHGGLWGSRPMGLLYNFTQSHGTVGQPHAELWGCGKCHVVFA